ncbi:ParA family protein [Thioclava sp. FR2]|uniref:ParA family protein n=1 Tax=Thioclava sp. FR2 TaxID=3445780 RepID=UPI003EBF41AD
MRVTILNPQSGTGKTTTALYLSIALAHEGVSVQIVDLDPKVVLSQALVSSGQMLTPVEPAVYEQSKKTKNLLGYPSVEIHTVDKHEALAAEVTQFLPSHRGKWQILDTSSVAAIGHQALISDSDIVLIPVRPEPVALHTMNDLVSDLQAIGMPLSALRILISQYSNRISQHRVTRSRLIDRFGSQAVVPVVIRTSSKLSVIGDSTGVVFQDAPRSTGASDYAQLARSLLSEQALWRAM